ncbi:MAG: DMT family transporter [Pyrinomonadaceae bacterium]
MKSFLLTLFALVAFAFNSILCRMALGKDEIDAASFTSIRLLSGAVVLLVLVAFVRFCGSPRVSKGDSLKLDDSPLLTRGLLQKEGGLLHFGNWLSAFFLFAYAVCFSFAYLGLTTGTGALILFGSVQMTMIAVSLVRGERPRVLEWLGLFIAVGGLVYLVFPGLTSPPLVNSALMAAAGISWGVYTLRGRSSKDPLADTMGNFVRSLPMIAVVAAVFYPQIHLSNRGIILAILSGAVASGVGYTIWYTALKFHTATRAAVLQLSVPVIAAVGGIVFLAETFSTRLLIAGILIILGIGMTILGKRS